MNLWKSVFDTCLSSLPGAYVSRYVIYIILVACTDNTTSGETKSNSTIARKNSGAQKRHRVGHLYDSVFSINSREVGVAEHGRMYPNENERKWASDKLKAAKVLHDMLAESPSPGFAVVGIVTAAWHCQMMRMGYAKGYICVLNPDQRREVPLYITESTSRELAYLLAMAWNMRVGVHFFSFFLAEVSVAYARQAVLSTNQDPSTSTQPAAELGKQLLAYSDFPPSVSKISSIPRSVETDEECDAVDEVAELRGRLRELEQQLAMRDEPEFREGSS